MRGGFRWRTRDEEEESVFVSMTDMTVSFLFIVMILLAFFASQFQPDNTVPSSIHEPVKQERDQLRSELSLTVAQRDAAVAEVTRLEALIEQLSQRDPLEVYVAEANKQRAELLRHLRDAILVEFPDLDVVISSENDALRFQGEGLFLSGSAEIRAERMAIVRKIADTLDELLPCYTRGPRAQFSEQCNSAFAVIEAVQIEGHTDSNGPDYFNIRLSAERGAATYITMAAAVPQLVDHLNLDGQPVLSVAGYGENRPVASNETPEGRSANRRIDLRFIMFTPSRSDEIQTIKQQLRDVVIHEEGQ